MHSALQLQQRELQRRLLPRSMQPAATASVERRASSFACSVCCSLRIAAPICCGTRVSCSLSAARRCAHALVIFEACRLCIGPTDAAARVASSALMPRIKASISFESSTASVRQSPYGARPVGATPSVSSGPPQVPRAGDHHNGGHVDAPREAASRVPAPCDTSSRLQCRGLLLPRRVLCTGAQASWWGCRTAGMTTSRPLHLAF